ncbi:ead/Ea22-like family protein [Citrobacter freundii]|uniref:ead/Ea22-like family protein n=1 Tax=Citrobacter freundii TaxID=546 RepID=UPI003B26888C
MTALNKQALNPEELESAPLELKRISEQPAVSTHYARVLRKHIANLNCALGAAEKRIAELEARKAKPVMFIDGDISPADADKLASVIREFNEETETPAARMARIIRENPHPTNMCDMPAAGIGVKGE